MNEVQITLEQLKSAKEGGDYIIDLDLELFYIEYHKIIKENMPKRIELDLK